MPQDELLVARATWTAEGVDKSALEELTGRGRFARGVGLPGSAWERCEPLYQTSATASESTQGQRPVPGGPWALVAIPARVGDDVLGVVELYLPSRRRAQLILPSLNPATYLLGSLLERWRGQAAQSKLTPRELELLTLASNGLTSAKIADQLWLSPWTVKTHFEHIRLKLNVSDRTAAVAYGLRVGMIG
jgi:DNA-binding CsgD family transcriptional regulator